MCVCVFYAQSNRTVVLGRILLVVRENHCETQDFRGICRLSLTRAMGRGTGNSTQGSPSSTVNSDHLHHRALPSLVLLCDSCGICCIYVISPAVPSDLFKYSKIDEFTIIVREKFFSCGRTANFTFNIKKNVTTAWALFSGSVRVLAVLMQ